MMVLEQAAKLTKDNAVRFAALVHDLGKALSPKEHLPKHHGHGQKGLPLIKSLCERFRVPNEYRDLALLVSDQHQNIHKVTELRADTLVKLFDKADFWRKPQRLEQLLLACEADSKGRTGLELSAYPQASYLKQCFAAASGIDVKGIIEQGFKGAEIREQLGIKRIAAVQTVKDMQTIAHS